jgi:hypothetical protein
MVMLSLAVVAVIIQMITADKSVLFHSAFDTVRTGRTGIIRSALIISMVCCAIIGITGAIVYVVRSARQLPVTAFTFIKIVTRVAITGNLVFMPYALQKWPLERFSNLSHYAMKSSYAMAHPYGGTILHIADYCEGRKLAICPRDTMFLKNGLFTVDFFSLFVPPGQLVMAEKLCDAKIVAERMASFKKTYDVYLPSSETENGEVSDPVRLVFGTKSAPAGNDTVYMFAIDGCFYLSPCAFAAAPVKKE